MPTDVSKVKFHDFFILPEYVSSYSVRAGRGTSLRLLDAECLIPVLCPMFSRTVYGWEELCGQLSRCGVRAELEMAVVLWCDFSHFICLLVFVCECGCYHTAGPLGLPLFLPPSPLWEILLPPEGARRSICYVNFELLMWFVYILLSSSSFLFLLLFFFSDSCFCRTGDPIQGLMQASTLPLGYTP